MTQERAFAAAVLSARGLVQSGCDPLASALALHQRWLELERASGVLDPRGVPDAFVDAVRVILTDATP